MATIYDDVAELMQRMQAAETAITDLQGDVNDLGDLSELENDVSELGTRMAIVEQLGGTNLATGADIHALEYGRYIVPTAAVSNTLVNAPEDAAGNTAIVDVIPGGGNGQKVIKYSICHKNSVIYYQDTYYSNAWGGWKCVDLTDTGWIDLPLADGIEMFSSGQKPQYRRIGNIVQIRGAVKGVLATGTIGTLPTGFRPTQSESVVQNTSIVDNHAAFTRMLVSNTGEVKIESASEGVAFAATKWFPIHCEFALN